MSEKRFINCVSIEAIREGDSLYHWDDDTQTHVEYLVMDTTPKTLRVLNMRDHTQPEITLYERRDDRQGSTYYNKKLGIYIFKMDRKKFMEN